MTRERPAPYLEAALEIFRRLGGNRIVELGSQRLPVENANTEWEGASTSLFARSGAELYSVDIDPQATETARQAAQGSKNAHCITADGIAFLGSFEHPIDLLYLDAWDVGLPGYKDRHCEAYLAARSRLHERSLLVIDDTDLDHAGKGELVIEAAEKDGYEIAYWGRQTLLLRPELGEIVGPLPPVGMPPPQIATYREAVAMHEAGFTWQAQRLYEQFLSERPDDAGLLHLLGLIRHQRGKHDQALALIGRAIAVDSSHPVFFSNYGAVLLALNRPIEALACFSHATHGDPESAAAWSNLGNVYLHLGNLQEAETALLRAHKLDPSHCDNLLRLGMLCDQQGRLDEAVVHLHEACALDPHQLEAYLRLGNTLVFRQQYHHAAEVYRAALDVAPRAPQLLFNVGSTLIHQNEMEEGKAFVQKACALAPGNRSWKLRLLDSCPMVFASECELDEWRNDLEQKLDELLASGVRFSPQELVSAGWSPPFGLGFHGRNNRRLKQKYAQIAAACIKPVEVTPRPGKVRLGVVVTQAHEGIFVRCFAGILDRLDPDAIDVRIFCSVRSERQLKEQFKRRSIQFSAFRDDLNEVVNKIASSACHILFHWEAGTDSVNYLLPFFRLAPVQCTSWGTHITSGIPAMTDYLSCDLVEGPDADRYCTERLIRLSSLPTFQNRRPFPQLINCNALGLPDGRTVYLGFHTLHKYTPDHDWRFGEILRRDERGVLAIKECPFAAANARLKARMAKTLPDVFDRILFVPWQPHQKYEQLVATADVLLDTQHFSAGSSSYDAFSFNQPLVTLPGQFNTGRYTLGCYRKMQFTELVASSDEHYIELAIRLGRDTAYRRWVREEITSRTVQLFEDQETVDEHLKYFLAAANRDG